MMSRLEREYGATPAFFKSPQPLLSMLRPVPSQSSSQRAHAAAMTISLT